MSRSQTRFANQALVVGEVAGMQERTFPRDDGSEGSLLSLSFRVAKDHVADVVVRQEHSDFVAGLLSPGTWAEIRGTLKERLFDGRRFVSMNALPPMNFTNLRVLESAAEKGKFRATLTGEVAEFVRGKGKVDSEATFEVKALNPATGEQVIQTFHLAVKAKDSKAFDQMNKDGAEVKVKVRVESKSSVDDYGETQITSRILVEQYGELTAVAKPEQESPA